MAIAGSVGDQDQMVIRIQSVACEPWQRVTVERVIGQIVQDVRLIDVVDDFRIP